MHDSDALQYDWYYVMELGNGSRIYDCHYLDRLPALLRCKSKSITKLKRSFYDYEME